MHRAAQALGATLYTLLLSAHPYGGDAASDVHAAALAGPPFFPQAGMPHMCGEIWSYHCPLSWVPASRVVTLPLG